MKEYIKSNFKGIILVIIAVITTCILGINNHNKEVFVEPIEFAYTTVEEPKELTEEEIYAIFLTDNANKINFYADAFKIDAEVLNNLLIENKDTLQLMNNVDTMDNTIISYLFNLEQTNRELFDNTITPAPADITKEYMVNLIKYLCNYYNVDFNIAAGIAEIESGYSARGMLNANNIFGGMSSGGLIRYKTIEYGIIRYITMLNDGYFGKGLTTVESIGYIYNPTTNEAGQKIANPGWVMKVNNAKSHYYDVAEITDISELTASE